MVSEPSSDDASDFDGSDASDDDGSASDFGGDDSDEGMPLLVSTSRLILTLLDRR